MDRALRPIRFDVNPNEPNAAKEFTHWMKTFEHYCEVLPQTGLDKLKLLPNYLSPQVFDYINDKTTYDDAVKALKDIYVKPSNEVFARHLLKTRKQQNGESIDDFLQELRTLSKDCSFKDVDKILYASESIRDAFIAGIQSNVIRRRLLENNTLDLDTMYDQARSLDIAQRSSESYNHPPPSINAAVNRGNSTKNDVVPDDVNCWNCGNRRHPKKNCPAKDVICHLCRKKGHFSRLCRSSASNNYSTAI